MDIRIENIILILKKCSEIKLHMENKDYIYFMFPFSSTINYFEDMRNKSISCEKYIIYFKMFR
jgi:hypothetical protein